MTKTEIVNYISLKCGIKKKDVAKVVDTFLEQVKESVKDNQKVEIRGFGTFYQAVKKARKVHSPIAERVLNVPSKTVLAFKGSKATEQENNEGA